MPRSILRHRLPFHESPVWSRASLAGLLALALLSAVGCATPFPSERVPRTSILILDFRTPPGIRENPKEVLGWWLSARTIHQNPHAGSAMAERLSSRLSSLPFVELYPRLDLRYYFAEKRQNLEEAFPALPEEKVEALVADADPLAYARELGADKLLRGRVVRNYLSDHRTVHVWSSVIEVDVELVDALSGRTEWRRSYRDRAWLASQFSSQDRLARRIARDLREEYFRPRATAPSGGATVASAAP